MTDQHVKRSRGDRNASHSCFQKAGRSHRSPPERVPNVSRWAPPMRRGPDELVTMVAAMTVEAVMPAPMATTGTEANEHARAIAVVGIPAVAAPIAPASMAMAERPIVHRLDDGRLVPQ